MPRYFIEFVIFLFVIVCNWTNERTNAKVLQCVPMLTHDNDDDADDELLANDGRLPVIAGLHNDCFFFQLMIFFLVQRCLLNRRMSLRVKKYLSHVLFLMFLFSCVWSKGICQRAPISRSKVASSTTTTTTTTKSTTTTTKKAQVVNRTATEVFWKVRISLTSSRFHQLTHLTKKKLKLGPFEIVVDRIVRFKSVERKNSLFQNFKFRNSSKLQTFSFLTESWRTDTEFQSSC